MYVRSDLVGVEVTRVSPICGRVLTNSFLANYFEFSCGPKGASRYDVCVRQWRLLVCFLSRGSRSALTRLGYEGVRRFHPVVVRDRERLQVGRCGPFGLHRCVARFHLIQLRRLAAHQRVGRWVLRARTATFQTEGHLLSLCLKTKCHRRHSRFLPFRADAGLRLDRDDGEDRDLSAGSRNVRDGRVDDFAGFEDHVTLGERAYVYFQRAFSVVGRLGKDLSYVRCRRIGILDAYISDVLRRFFGR